MQGNNTYVKTEIVGTSDKSVDDAIKTGLAAASKTIRNMDWFEVAEIRGLIDNDKVAYFQVTMKVGFRHDD